VNGRRDVGEGEVLFLRGTDSVRPSFVAPLPLDQSPRLTWARIDSADGSTYGWTEMTYYRGTFVERDGGESARAGSSDAAVEVNGLTAPVGSLVVLYTNPGYPAGRRTFEYGGSDPGFWAILLRSFKSAVYAANFAGATGGSWTLGFDPGPNPAPGTAAGSVSVSSGATAAAVQAALDPLTAGDVTVAGGSNALSFTLTGALAGASGASLTGSGDGLTFAQTTLGRDLPFTDGAGGYSWVRTEFDAFGRLVAGGTGSVWPANLALESHADHTVPEGAVVWCRPRTSGFVRKPDAGSGDFAGWSQDELDAHLTDVDAGDGWLSDDGVDFHWLGATSFWARLTDGPDANDLYPFEVVHMGGRDAASDPADGPQAVTPEALRDARLTGLFGAKDTFESPLAATDRAWVVSRPGGRSVTGVAKEVLSRRGLTAGTVVRVYVTPAAGGGVGTPPPQPRRATRLTASPSAR
jgi:hypothetical protein